MFPPGGDEVDPGGLDGAVAQHVRQLGDVSRRLVKHPGEQMPQVVGKDLAGRHPGFFAERLHLRPNLFARENFAASGPKYRPGGGIFSFCIGKELLPQLPGDEDGADLSF